MTFRFADAMRSALIQLFDAYIEATGQSSSSVSAKFMRDRSFYSRLPFNRPTVRSTDILIQKFSDEWPPYAIWPADLPRPPVGKWDDLKEETQRPGGKARAA